MRHEDVIGRLRRAAPALPTAPGPAAEAYVAKIERAAHTVTDSDVEALRAEGLGEEQIFELTVAAALRAGMTRLDAGLEQM